MLNDGVVLTLGNNKRKNFSYLLYYDFKGEKVTFLSRHRAILAAIFHGILCANWSMIVMEIMIEPLTSKEARNIPVYFLQVFPFLCKIPMCVLLLEVTKFHLIMSEVDQLFFIRKSVKLKSMEKMVHLVHFSNYHFGETIMGMHFSRIYVLMEHLRRLFCSISRKISTTSQRIRHTKCC